MNAKEYLLSYKTLQSKIRLFREKIDNAEKTRKEFAVSMRVWADISDYQDALYEQIEDMISLRFKIERSIALSPLEDTEREVLERRFILDETWEEISEKTLYSVVNLHRIEKKALSKIKFQV